MIEKIGMFDYIGLPIKDQWCEFTAECPSCNQNFRMLLKKYGYSESNHIRQCIVCGKRCKYREIKDEPTFSR